VQRTVESKLQDVVSVKDFGAVGDGVTDDATAIQAAINAAQGSNRTLVIPGNKSYLIGSGLSVTAPLLIVGEGKKPMLIGTQSLANAQTPILSLGAATGTTYTLAASIGIGDLWISLTSVSGLSKGDIIRISSNTLHYYDNRSQWYKGDTHLIQEVDAVGNRVRVDMRAWDAYTIPAETITVTCWTPRQYGLKNIGFVHQKPTTNISTIAVQIRRCIDSTYSDLYVESGTSAGIQLGSSYRPTVENCVVRDSNRGGDLDTGYGIHDLGCVGLHINKCKFFNCRRGVDLSALTGTTSASPSRLAVIENCVVFGGIRNSANSLYFPEGSSPNYGLGGHGPQEYGTFRHNILGNLTSGINVRGGHNFIHDNLFIGKMDQCIQLTEGEIARIEDNRSTEGFSGQKDSGATSLYTNQAPNTFVNIGSNFNIELPITIKGNTAYGLSQHFIDITKTQSGDVRRMRVVDNNIVFRRTDSSIFYVIKSAIARNFGDSIVRNNDIIRAAGTAPWQDYDPNLTLGYRSNIDSHHIVDGSKVFIFKVDDNQEVRLRGVRDTRYLAIQIVPLDDLEPACHVILDSTSPATVQSLGYISTNMEFGPTSLSGGTPTTAGKFAVRFTAGSLLQFFNKLGGSRRFAVTIF
jgi:hypothetical protein